jgi:Glycine zipper
MAMRKLNGLALVTIAMLAAACGRSKSPALDDALKNDLALASQAQAYNPQQFASPTEAGYAAQPQTAPRALQTAARQPSTSARRAASTVRRSSGSGTSSQSGGYYPAPTPPTTIEKNTGRDAAIGAVAGAILGASTSRNKMSAGVIGAAAGGILGAVIGNNVDVHKKTGW